MRLSGLPPVDFRLVVGTGKILTRNYWFTSEKTSYIKNGTEVVEKPTEPSGSDILAKLKPAFYLYAPLPGADTQRHYCGHGQDFFFAKDLDKQFCYD
jgi:hypothetical protein